MKTLLRCALALAVLAASGCSSLRWKEEVSGRTPRDYVLLTTGYCPCGTCCGWHRNWFGRPVLDSNPHRAKRVGWTASGTRATHGTIAADTAVFPFGTVMYIPDYGYGRVEDTGGDIKGYHVDLFFSAHSHAQEWGSVRKRVTVWFPDGR